MLASLLSAQLPANVPGTAGENGPTAWPSSDCEGPLESEVVDRKYACSLSLLFLSAFQTSKSFKEEESSAREERGQCICSPSSLSVWGALEVAMFFRLPHITLCWPLLEVPTLIGSWHKILLRAP